MFRYLLSEHVNLQIFQEVACRELLKVFEKCDGSKILVLDDSLFGSIRLIANNSFFSDRNIKLLKLSSDTIYPRDLRNVIYLTRPDIKLMDIIAEYVNRSCTERLFHLFFVPRKSCVCMKHLENKGVLETFVSIDEIPWNFFPLDSDVLSMELPLAFKEIVLDEDHSTLFQAAIGLVQLQKIYGRIPKIYGKGNYAQKVWTHAKLMGAEDKTMFNADKGVIDQMILLDRSIDFMSVFATQLTYEGLIDEIFGIHNNNVTFPADLFIAQNNDERSQVNLVSEKKVMSLNSGEALYADLRNKNFNEVGKILSKSAKEISYQMGGSTQDKSVQDMKRLVDKLPELLAQKQSVANHTSIAQEIRKYLDVTEFTEDLTAEQEFMICEDIEKPSMYIEYLIAKKRDLRDVIRLICIQCFAASGFKEKVKALKGEVLNHYKRELSQVYGIEVLLTISNLERAGLLGTHSENRTYAVLRKTLSLTVDDVIEVDPKDISYVHSFYAPLTVRIVEQTLKPLGWQSLKNQINNLPGQSFEDFQAQLIGIGGRQSSTLSEGSSFNIPRVVLVFIIGGCTHAEVSAIRFLSQQEDNNVKFVIATTKLVNKNTFLNHIM